MVDIDHFKVINDTHGHPVGDVVLRGVGGAIQRGLRESDLCCRFGGEEFVVIMPDTSLRESVVVAERMRTSVEAMSWPGLAALRTTVSVGVAGLDLGQRGPSALEWIEAADKALYAAKQGGRNRVVSVPVGSDRARMAG
jgi:diguanylate cyclase (GGDEF)-like protein